MAKWRRQLKGVERGKRPSVAEGSVFEALCDDLNTALAITRLHALSLEDDKKELLANLELLGFAEGWEDGLDADIRAMASIQMLTAELTTLRQTAMATKDFAPVDALKAALVAAGVEVRMSKEGVELLPGPGFDPAKLAELE